VGRWLTEFGKNISLKDGQVGMPYCHMLDMPATLQWRARQAQANREFHLSDDRRERWVPWRCLSPPHYALMDIDPTFNLYRNPKYFEGLHQALKQLRPSWYETMSPVNRRLLVDIQGT